MNLFEVLVTLAIISAVTAVVLSGRGTQHPGLQLQKQASELVAQAATHRNRAVGLGQTVTARFEKLRCDALGGVAEIAFFPDGTARGDALCLSQDDLRVELRPDPLTGRLVQVAP